MELLALILAIIIVTAKLILEAFEAHDKRIGIPVNHKDYTFTGIINSWTKRWRKTNGRKKR